MPIGLQLFNTPEEFDNWLEKLGVDPTDLDAVVQEDDIKRVVGEYNSNFPTNLCPHCKAPLPEHQMTIVDGLVLPCPLAPNI